MKIYNLKPLTLTILSGFLVFTTPSWSIVSQSHLEINATIDTGKFIFTGVTNGRGRCFYYPSPNPTQPSWNYDSVLCQGGASAYDRGYPYILIRNLPSEWTLSGGIYPPVFYQKGAIRHWVFYTNTSQITVPLTLYSQDGYQWIYEGNFSVPGGRYNIFTTEPDGHYTASLSLSFGTSPTLGAGADIIIPGVGGTVNLEYDVRNGGVVPPYIPVTCNFSRMYPDTSGTSSGTNILHDYGNMKSGTTDSKTTMLVYSCDQSASSFTASLINAGIFVKKNRGGC